MGHEWATCLHNPNHQEGGTQPFRAEDRIRTGPEVVRVATLPLTLGMSPALHSGGHNQQRPGSGPDCYITATT